MRECPNGDLGNKIVAAVIRRRRGNSEEYIRLRNHVAICTECEANYVNDYLYAELLKKDNPPMQAMQDADRNALRLYSSAKNHQV